MFTSLGSRKSQVTKALDKALREVEKMVFPDNLDLSAVGSQAQETSQEKRRLYSNGETVTMAKLTDVLRINHGQYLTLYEEAECTLNPSTQCNH